MLLLDAIGGPMVNLLTTEKAKTLSSGPVSIL